MLKPRSLIMGLRISFILGLHNLVLILNVRINIKKQKKIENKTKKEKSLGTFQCYSTSLLGYHKIKK